MASAPRQSMSSSRISLSLDLFQNEDFQTTQFIRSHCRPLDYKGLHSLRAELLRLKEQSMDEMREEVVSSYSSLIGTLHKIADLEGSLSSMHALLSTKAAIVNDLMKRQLISEDFGNNRSTSLESSEDTSLSLERQFQTLMDKFDVSFVDRNVQVAAEAIKAGEKLLPTIPSQGFSLQKMKDLQKNLLERRSKLIKQLIGSTEKLSVSTVEVEISVNALKELGEGSRGHDMLLDLYHRRIQHDFKNIRPCGAIYGRKYVTALSQSMFSKILESVKVSSAVFKDSTGFSSKVMLWSYKEVQDIVRLLEKHVLLGTGGLHASVECIRVAYGHCLLLESHGISLSSNFCKAVDPILRSLLQRNLEHVLGMIMSLTAADDWSPGKLVSTRKIDTAIFRTNNGKSDSKSEDSSEQTSKLSYSAYELDILAQNLASDCAPLFNMAIGGFILDGLSCLFNSYMHCLLKAMPEFGMENSCTDHPVVKRALTMTQQITILANASYVAEEIFPCVALLSIEGCKCRYREDSLVDNAEPQFSLVWKSRFQQLSIKIQNLFSKFHKEDFISKHTSLLNSDIYTIDGWSGDVLDQDLKPSAFFQELFLKVNTIAQSALIHGDLLSNPLMKIVKGVLLWLKNYDDFWTGFENNKRSLKSEGCIQFVFDLEFVAQFALNGKFSSKSLRGVISDLICSVQNIYAVNGSDPQRIMPTDEWFVKETKRALNYLLSRTNATI